MGKEHFSPEEWADFQAQLVPIAATIEASCGVDPLKASLAAPILLCRRKGFLDLALIYAAVLTVCSKGDRRKLLAAVNELAAECSPKRTREPKP